MRKVFLLGLFMLLIPFSMLAQNITVSGKVIDAETNESLVGVTVVQAGTTNGTITDLDGKYSLSVPSDSKLQFSYMGYLQQTLDVAGKTEIICSLSQDVKQIDEVVAVGYGTAKKSDLTGSVASVSEDALKNRATPDAASALQGKAAGVQVLTNSGAPGSGASIRVRGMSSNSGNLGPLLIVDGLKVDNIQYLDPENIEHMEVLKDAASAAIYGAQAGNGVVLITTKSGSKSKDGEVFYNAQWQLSSLSGKLDVLNAEQYIDFGRQNGFIMDGTLERAGWDGKEVDWADEVFEPTWNSRHTIGVKGGNDRGNYFASLNYVNNDGIFKGDKDSYKRYTLQVNADYKIKSWLTISSNNNFEKWDTKSVSSNNENGSALLAAITSDPLFGPYCDTEDQLSDEQKAALAEGTTVLQASDGRYYRLSPISGQTQSANPFIMRDNASGTSGGYSLRGSTQLNFNPIPGLLYTSRFGYRLSTSTSHNYTFPYYGNNFNCPTTYSISANVNSEFYYTWENFVNYSKTFAEKHDVSLMAGMSWEQTENDNISGSSSGTEILKDYAPNYRYLSYLLPDATKSLSNEPGQYKSMAYFGRFTYSYDNRYSVQFNFRADAFDSSKLDEDHRWGKFPSVSAGWVVSNESFVADAISTDILSFLKIRASWGKNGNINVLSGYPYRENIRKNDDFYQYTSTGEATYSSAPEGKLGNPELVWEESQQIDLGFDARFLNSRLSVSFDWFTKKTDGLLANVKPIIESGVGQTSRNIGSVENKGIEIELGWQDHIGKVHYSANANFSYIHNELVELDPVLEQIPGGMSGFQGSEMGTRCTLGNELWYFYGYKFDHFDNEGQAHYVDFDGDGNDMGDSDDRTNIGSGQPDFTYGFTISADYKGFDLSIFATGVHGVDILPLAWRIDRPYCNNYAWFYENSYDVSTGKGNYPAISKWDKQALASDLSLFDGSYFKIKQIQLGYTVPKNIIKKVKLSQFRVFASLENFFTFTNYIGLDPEVASANSSNQLGVDFGMYPTAKQVIFGVNVSF